MFSFHRPKVYRSSTGCCICKAKSSSSRFTDSKKYEDDFMECFKLSTPRQGEICNACVLLVKRWKKLPIGSDRHWQHVVDARAGPGMKSMTKFNKIKNMHRKIDTIEKLKKKKDFERELSPGLSDKSEGNEDIELVEDFLSEDGPSGRSSCTGSPGGSDNEEPVEKSRRKKAKATRRTANHDNFDFEFDMDYWKRETICCGVIYRGLNNEVMFDPSYVKPCPNRLNCSKKQQSAVAVATAPPVGAAGKTVGAVAVGGKIYSDSSSDSGYDESSNQGNSPQQENAPPPFVKSIGNSQTAKIN